MKEILSGSLAVMGFILITLIAAYIRLDSANKLRAFRNGPLSFLRSSPSIESLISTRHSRQD